MPPTAAAAMAATPAGEQSLVFFLQPLFLHSVSAAVHLIVALAVAGRFLFRILPIFAGRAKDRDGVGEDAGRGIVGFRSYRVALCTTWALAAFDALLAAYSWYANAGATGWSRDAVAEQADAAARAAAWLLLAAFLQAGGFGRHRLQSRFPAALRLWWALFMLL
ncbi:unnamed protein product [Urochloa humidicola]